MSERLHSCGYFCDRPECAIAQRDELVLNKEHMEQRIKELEASLFLCEAANVNARLEGTEMRKLLERIDIKAQAGLCQMTFAGAREFLKDIRLLVLERTK